LTKHLKYIFAMIAVGVFVQPALSQNNYFSPDNLLKFANYLYYDEDYLRAAGEYKRYLLTTNDYTNADTISYRIVRSLRLGGDLDGAIVSAFPYLYPYPLRQLSEKIQFESGLAYFKQGNYWYSLNVIDNFMASEVKKELHTYNLIVANHLRMRHWNKALEISNQSLTKARNSDNPDSYSFLLHLLTQEAAKLPYKQKWKAGFLSVAVPGSGKFYTGEYTDCFVSLLLTGVSAWQSWRGFDRNGSSSKSGWVYGTLGSGFYLSGIYGSMVSVKRYNIRLELRIFEQLEEYVDDEFRDFDEFP